MLVLDFIKYWFTSDNAHGIHSPFVFDLYTRIIKPDLKFYIFDDIEHCRDSMLISDKKIVVNDFGAGSKKNNSREKSIRQVASVSLKPAKIGKLLFKMVNEFQTKTIFDLGTSLGITTMYLAGADRQNTVFTFEGCENIAAVAESNFKKLNFKNIHQTIGNLDETLELMVDKTKTIDLVFFDANHKFEPTIRYFDICLEKINENSVFIFDDIYWSEEMKKAWETIKNHPSVTLSIDLFEVGLIFFRKESLEKQHFKLKF